MVFHTAMFLIKELTSGQMKYNDGSRLKEFTGLPMFPITLKELGQWNGRMHLLKTQLQCQL